MKIYRKLFVTNNALNDKCGNVKKKPLVTMRLHWISYLLLNTIFPQLFS